MTWTSPSRVADVRAQLDKLEREADYLLDLIDAAIEANDYPEANALEEEYFLVRDEIDNLENYLP